MLSINIDHTINDVESMVISRPWFLGGNEYVRRQENASGPNCAVFP
jgi:hypothetical protein